MNLSELTELQRRILWVVLFFRTRNREAKFTSWLIRMAIWDMEQLSLTKVSSNLEALSNRGYLVKVTNDNKRIYYVASKAIDNDEFRSRLKQVFKDFHKEGTIFKLGKNIFQTTAIHMERNFFSKDDYEVLEAECLGSSNTHIFSRKELKRVKNFKVLGLEEQAVRLRQLVDKETLEASRKLMGLLKGFSDYPEQINKEIFGVGVSSIRIDNDKKTREVSRVVIKLDSGRTIEIFGRKMSVSTRNKEPKSKDTPKPVMGSNIDNYDISA